MDDVKKSFNYLLIDIIQGILSRAGDPSSCAAFTAEQLRTIIGARTVMVIECSEWASSHQHEIISVFPARRAKLGKEEAILRMSIASHGFTSARLFKPDETGVIPEALLELQSGPTILSPLMIGQDRIGVLMLLDLMDTQHLDTIIDTLNDLSTVLALILRNASLYKHLEQEVQRRTAELEEKNLVLEKALSERELLLKEVHHRVKNNLQIINSLMYLQASHSSDPTVHEALEKSQKRIYSMALVHEELYLSQDFEYIDFMEYTNKLCQNYDDFESNQVISIQVKGNKESIFLPITYAVPLGIIMNELITNALKYAYPADEGGIIRVLIEQKERMITITVEDEGIGIPEDLLYNKKRSLGLSLIETLTEQLHGSFSIQNKKCLREETHGTVALITFPWEHG
ncbi:MAG: hypothetical protein GX438_11445 [Treponema sp.]|nr:hypothetical protein [Treponema sp.]